MQRLYVLHMATDCNNALYTQAVYKHCTRAFRDLCRRYQYGVLPTIFIFGHINNKRAPSRSLWEAKLVRAQSVV